MSHFRMVTVTDKYLPLAGGGNTMRKVSDKYRSMRPGDTVQMDYGPADAEKVDIVVKATEHLEVASVVFGPYADVMGNHAYANHGDASPDELHAFFVECYGELADDVEFMAIYFR